MQTLVFIRIKNLGTQISRRLFRYLFRVPIEYISTIGGTQKPASNYIAEISDQIIEGIEGDEKKALEVAKWLAENITNIRASESGTEIVLREKRGLCGARARIFTEMLMHQGIEARVFGLYNKGMRHSVAQVCLQNKWCFVDTMWGAIFRGQNGELLNFSEMLSDPELAIKGMEVLGGTADYVKKLNGQELKPFDHIAKLKDLYSLDRLQKAKTYGYLYDSETPITYYPNVDLKVLNKSAKIHIYGNDNEFLNTATQLVDSPLPNFFGSPNKFIMHQWTFNNTEPNKPFFIHIQFSKIPKLPLQLFLDVSGAKVATDNSIILDRKIKNNSWKILFEPENKIVSLKLFSKFEKWAHKVTIESISIDYENEEDRFSKTVNDSAYDHSDKDTLLTYLLEECSITKVVQSGKFSVYEKRPHNWSWVFHGNAAIFAYRATGDIRFLRWIIDTFEVISKNRDLDLGRVDDLRKRKYASWGSYVKDRKTGGLAWVNEVCTAGCIGLPASLAAVEVISDNNLQQEFGDRIDKILQCCEQIADEFREDLYDIDGKDQSYYIMPHDGAPEPFAHTAPFAAMLAALYKATGNEEYFHTANKLANFFKTSIRKDRKGLWSWPYRPKLEDTPIIGEYYFKARVTLMFPIHAYSLGLFFDEEDMINFTNTFLEAICRSKEEVYTRVSQEHGELLDDDLLQRYIIRGKVNTIAHLSGYYPLSAINPEVGNRIDQIVATWTNIFPKSWFSVPSSVEAYAIRLDPKKAMNIEKIKCN